MNRTTIILGAAGVLAAAAVLAGVATGSTQQSWTIVLDAHQTGTHFVDNAPKGESPGDQISFTDTLRRHGAVVGYAEATGTLVDAKRDANQLQGTFTLPQGRIMIAGISIGSAPTQTFAIIGGTGRYQGVHGTATMTTRGNTTAITLRAQL